jgi:hypothetical protein
MHGPRIAVHVGLRRSDSRQTSAYRLIAFGLQPHLEGFAHDSGALTIGHVPVAVATQAVGYLPHRFASPEFALPYGLHFVAANLVLVPSDGEGCSANEFVHGRVEFYLPLIASEHPHAKVEQIPQNDLTFNHGTASEPISANHKEAFWSGLWVERPNVGQQIPD